MLVGSNLTQQDRHCDLEIMVVVYLELLVPVLFETVQVAWVREFRDCQLLEML